MNKQISLSQFLFGICRLDKLQAELNLDIPKEQLAKILLDIQKLKKFWSWVNTEDFLYKFLEFTKQYNEKEK